MFKFIGQIVWLLGMMVIVVGVSKMVVLSVFTPADILLLGIGMTLLGTFAVSTGKKNEHDRTASPPVS